MADLYTSMIERGILAARLNNMVKMFKHWPKFDKWIYIPSRVTVTRITISA